MENEINIGSVLSNRAILRHIKEGNIIIEPFNPRQLSTSSYDVTLGEYYFEAQQPKFTLSIYNPYSEEEVYRIWGLPKKALPAREIAKWGPTIELFGAKEEDLVILVPPRKIFLCHTQEFIGGRNCVTTMMKARSSFGRNFIEVCRDAGWGDVGYINRWTMEITNTSEDYAIPIVVGRRIAQIVFFEVEKPLEEYENYIKVGKYQHSKDLDEIKATWSPEDMLPKLYNDYEVEGLLKENKDV